MKKIKVTAQELVAECLRGEQNLYKVEETAQELLTECIKGRAKSVKK